MSNLEQKVIRSNILLPELEASYRNEYTEYSRRNLRFSDAGAAADDGEKCEREIFYDMTCPDKKSLLTSGTLVLFDDGRIHEADVRRRLRLLFDSPERELKDEEILLNGRPCSGKIDNTVKMVKIRETLFKCLADAGIALPPFQVDPTFGTADPVVELKSVNEFSYQMMARDNRISQSYYDQIQMYLHETRKNIAICLIKNRNSSGDEKGALPFLEFIVLPDPERQTQIRAGLKTTAECCEKGILPRRPFLMSSTKCSYCRFKYECWPEYKAKLEAQATALVPDATVEAPGQEILEGALRSYNAGLKARSEAEKQMEEARSVIERYFKATAKPDLVVGNITATYSSVSKSYLDKEKLIGLIGTTKYAMVSLPNTKLIEQAIEDREIDAKVLADVTLPGKPIYQLRVSEKDLSSEREKAKQAEVVKAPAVKKEKSDDKRNKRGSKNTKARKDTPRNKGKKGQ